MGGLVNSINDAVGQLLDATPLGHLADPGDALAHRLTNMLVGKSSRSGPGTPDSAPTRDVNQSITSTVAPANMVYGTRRVGGVFAFYGLSGTNGEYLWYVQIVACHEVNAMSNLVIDGNFIPEASFDGSGNVIAGMYSGLVQRFIHLGTTTQTVDTNLDAAFTEWTTAFTGLNLAYVVVKMKRDDTAFPQVPTSIQIDVQGKKVYDPRHDSTVTGGSGSQRNGTPSTWTWSNNAVLCIRDYLTGSTNLGCMGWPQTVMNDPNIITQANSADASVSYLVNGVTQSQSAYAVDGVLTTDQTYGDNLALMLNCINGTLDNVNGTYTPVCGQYNAPSLTIDQTWFLAPAKCQFGAKTRDLYNSVRGKYYDNSQNYQELDYSPFSSATYVTADGGVIWRDLDLSLCTDLYRAQRLSTLVGRQSRNQQIVQLVLDWRGLQLALGMAVSLTIPNLFTTKTFSVNAITVTLDQNGLRVACDLLEDSATAHTWNSTDSVTVTFPVNPASVGDTPLTPTSFTVTGYADGIELNWVPPADGIYDHIEVWRSATSSFAGATLIGRVQASVYRDPNALGTSYWYWIRAVSVYNTYSSYTPSSGGAGTGATARWGVDITGSGTNLLPLSHALFNINGLFYQSNFIRGNLSISGQTVFSFRYLRYTQATGHGGQSGVMDMRRACDVGAQIQPVNLQIGKKYIFSVYISAATSASALPLNVTGFDASGTGGTTFGTAGLVAVPGESQRYSCVLDMTSATQPAAFYRYVTTNNMAVGDIFDIQCAMIEQQMGNNTHPSPWSPPGIMSIDHTDTVGGVKGSVVPTIPNTTFAYTSTTSAITWNWGAFSILRPDTSSTSIASGTTGACTGLTGSTQYSFYALYDDITLLAITFVGSIYPPQFGGAGAGSQGTAFPSAGSAGAAQTMTLLGFVPMSSSGMKASTTASGSGGGSGGGITGCLHPKKQWLDIMSHGVPCRVLAKDLEVGDEVLTTEGWQPILQIDRLKSRKWLRVRFNNGECYTVTRKEPFYHPDGTFTRAEDLHIGSLLQGYNRLLEVQGLKLLEDLEERVILTIKDPHLFFCTKDGALIHNGTYKP